MSTGIATIKAPVNCAPAQFFGMGIQASNVVFPAINGACYMQTPHGMGDLEWEGGQFGLSLSAPTSAAVRVTHRVSDPSAFDSITARLYAGSFPIGAPAQFRRSSSYVSDWVTAYTGVNAASLPALTVRVSWHQVGVGLAYVEHTYATTPAPVRASPPSGLMMAGIV